jgi:hypothetical protein
MLMLAGLIASGSPMPYSALAVIPLAWAGVEQVLSIRARAAAPLNAPLNARATPGAARTRGIVGSVVALVLVCLVSVMVLLPYAFYGTAKALQDCTLGANTAVAAADCNTRFHNGLDSNLRGFFRIG